MHGNAEECYTFMVTQENVILSRENICYLFYYNFAQRDHSEPTLGGILDMVKVMAFSLTEGKVAVHCHAGLGRTGVLISCYLVYSLRVRANDAIRFVRMKRPSAVQTSGQIMVVQEFEAFILPQLYVYCNRLLKLCGCGGSESSPTVLAPLEISFAIGTPAFTSFFLTAQFDHEGSRVSYSAPLSIESPLFYSSLSGSRSGGVRPGSEEDSGFTGNEEFSVGDVSAPNSAQYPARRLNQDCESPDVPSCVSGVPEQNIDQLLNDGIKDQQLTENLCYQELTSHDDLKKMAEMEKVKVILPKKIYEALLVDHHLLNTEYKKKLRSYRIELNIKQSAWDKLKTETDLYLLTGSTIYPRVPRPFCIETSTIDPRPNLNPNEKDDRGLDSAGSPRIRGSSSISSVVSGFMVDVVVLVVVFLVVTVIFTEGKGYTKLREGTLGKCVEFMMKFYDAIHLESRSTSVTSPNSSTPSTTTCVTPPDHVSHPNFNEEDDDPEIET
ncbi:Protein tyrosine phosphatase domain-containing protein 1 [Armadillidium nasatum]|uniref:Protein tyrosine phosphatase domain-containing protein 1 n=1 Tax=Armadillidium nasatum TaxID=96803 RepID=A0A5N5SKV4_9CRUS|nr:Protein tyrosine phosphatase domain-containing protein 1 [Armadillidium nasatum]